MPRARLTAKDIRDDHHFLRIIECEAFRAAAGDTSHRWLVRHAKMLIAFREETCADARQLNINDRDEAIRQLRAFKFSTLTSCREAARAVDTQLARYALNDLKADERRGGPPLNDPARALCYAICTARVAVPAYDQIRKVLASAGQKCWKPAAQRG